MQKIFVPLLCVISSLSIAQDLPVFVNDSLDNYVNRAMRQWQIPGVAVAVVKDGKTVVMKVYGVKECGKADKIDVNTMFMIGSNTKAFTATALAKLDAEKKLSLDDHVQKWLPDFKMYDPWVAKEATITDLLCHRLGFETFQGDFIFFDSDLSTQQMMEKFSKIRPKYSFRSKWGYTNAGFMVAGEIFPKATGQTWAQYITENIFKPLGMNSSLALSKDVSTATNMSAAHTTLAGPLRKVPYGRVDAMAPAGAISSSVSDMVRWVTMLLDTGKYEGRVIIPKSAIMETRTPRSIAGNGGHPFNKAHFELYGLGWDLGEYEGRLMVGHTGGVNGFLTSVMLVPEERLGIIVLTNTDSNSFFELLRYEIQDAFFGLPYRGYNDIEFKNAKAGDISLENWMKQLRDSVAMMPKTELPLKVYAGNYKHEVYGDMTMTLEGNKLVARFEHHKNLYANVEPLGKNRFLATFSEALYGRRIWPFTTDDGKVKSVTVTVEGFVESTPYEFVKVK